MTNQLSVITPNIFIHNNIAVTTSLSVAEFFNKQHKDVLKCIENLNCSPEFTLAHFCAHVKNQQVGTSRRDLKYYEMTKDGFIFLVMGFTGKKAALLKESYINAFNKMSEQLNLLQNVKQQVKPADVDFINTVREKQSVTFNADEITQLNALFETVDFLSNESWPHLKALFPDLNPDIDKCFSTIRITKGLLKSRVQECGKKAGLILSFR